MTWTKGWSTLSFATTWKWHWRPIHHQSIQIMPSHLKWGSLIAGVTEAGQELFCSLKSHYCCLQTSLLNLSCFRITCLLTDGLPHNSILSDTWEPITLQSWATYCTSEVDSFYLSAWQSTESRESCALERKIKMHRNNKKVCLTGSMHKVSCFWRKDLFDISKFFIDGWPTNGTHDFRTQCLYVIN